MIRYINNSENQSCIFYFHPWEIDPEQPKVKGVSFKTRVRHYSNLKIMKSKLEKILQEFNWGAMQEIFLPELQFENYTGNRKAAPIVTN